MTDPVAAINMARRRAFPVGVPSAALCPPVPVVRGGGQLLPDGMPYRMTMKWALCVAVEFHAHFTGISMGPDA
jgi:hypothetical protein